MADTKPKLRWYQFSLRSLLVFVTLCAIPCSWLAVKRQQATRQRQAVAAIEKLGGKVMYSGISWPPPEWLKSLLGVDFFWPVDSVELNGEDVTDADSKQLGDLGQLVVLSLMDTNITDSGLENLMGLNRLERSNLMGTKVTHVGVWKLQKALPNCTIVH